LPPVAAAGIAALGLLAGGCGQGAREGVAGEQTVSVTHRCVAGADRARGTRRSAVAAVVTRATTAYRRPGHTRLARFELNNVNGVPTVFSVLGERVDAGCRATWLHVQLPIRPNGVTGWVRAADVSTASVHTRIVVDLSERRVRFYRNGRLVLSSSAAIGSAATPTPLGRYYVNQRLVPTDTAGPFGPGAVGISAFSPVLTGWAQGGPIAIHGTNQPWSIGHDVSNGCIRLPNDVLRRLFAATPAGTPVIIRR
jgi:lipoprotein-anchoring transpeptidase ErfK/SrfK